MSNILADKAVLANLNIRAWSARRYDGKASREVANLHAAKDAGRFNKQLIAKDALAAIQKIANKARIAHASMTLPWLYDGTSILPSALYMRYSAEMQTLRMEYEAAVEAFCANYMDYKADAEQSLNGLFNEADYPSLATIRNRFAFGVRIAPCPVADDFRVDLSTEQKAALRSDMQAQLNEAMQGAQRDVAERIAVAVGHMAERLRAYVPAGGNGADSKAEGIFRDSLVENVRKLCELLPGLNVTGDAALSAIAARMRAALVADDADVLREDDNARERVAAAAESILSDVREFLA